MAKRPLESKKEGTRLHCAQVARGRKVSKFSESSWMDRRILPTPGQPHDDRHLLYRTLAEDRQAGPDESKKRFSNPLRIFSQVFDKNKDDRIPVFRRTSGHGKDHSMKHCEETWNGRVEIGKTYWSQPSSSSSSQQWWQHEHQDQWRDQQDWHFYVLEVLKISSGNSGRSCKLFPAASLRQFPGGSSLL